MFFSFLKRKNNNYTRIRETGLYFVSEVKFVLGKFIGHLASSIARQESVFAWNGHIWKLLRQLKSRSLIRLLGAPVFVKTCLKNIRSRSLAFAFLVVGIYSAVLVYRSIKTRMASQTTPSRAQGGTAEIKSIDKLCPEPSGTVNEESFPYGLLRSVLLYWHSGQLLTCATSVRRLSQ